MQGKLIALLCVVSALSLAACAENWIVTYDGQDSRGDREILHSTLTPDGTDSYTYRNFGSGGHVAAAPSNTRGNYRAVSAQHRADELARRPKSGWVVARPWLWEHAGVVA